jgi:transketolase
MRKTFSDVTKKIVSENNDVILLLGDIGVYAFRDILRDFPHRALNMGILEQSMIGIAAGISKSGLIPIVHTIAPFLVERAHEQLKIDFGYQRLSGNFISVGASYDYSSLGATHHAPGDIETLLGIPGMQICIPGHPDELEQQLYDNFDNELATYYRLSENCNSRAYADSSRGLVRIRNGSDATVIAVGPFLDRALISTNHWDCEIIYLNEICKETTLRLSNLISNDLIILVEPFYAGTLNHLVSTALTGRRISINNIGVPREFIHHYGTTTDLDDVLGLGSERISGRIREILQK